jgi:ribonuclease BN (tRNA processing enzyme)
VIERIIELTETNGAPFVKPKEDLPTPPPPSSSPVSRAQTQTKGRTPSPAMQARASSSNPPPSSPPLATRTPAAAAGRNDEYEKRGTSPTVQERREWGDADSERREAPRQKWSVTRGGTTTQGRMAGKQSEQKPDRRGQQGSRGGVGNGARLPASASELSEADMAALYRGDREEDYRPVTGTGARGARDNTADLELCFLGTASCLPSLTRGVSSIAMRMSGKAGGSSFWIFDAGEATQIQVQKSWIRPSSIDRIFITHLHGDHSFGIVGLMCLIGQDRPPERGPLEIFGPEGLRNMIRVTLQLSRSRAVPPYRVTELIGVPYLHGRYGRKPESECDRIKVPRDWRYREVDEGDDIYASEDGLWRIPEFNGFNVVAGPMQHTMMCVGYVVQEKRGTDRLKMDAVEDVRPVQN